MSFLNQEGCYEPIAQSASQAENWRKSEGTDALSSSTLQECDPISDECDAIFISQRTPGRGLNQRWPWICSTVLLGCTTTLLYIQSSFVSIKTIQHNREVYETDLRAVGAHVGREQIRFNGALSYNETGSLVRDHVPGDPVWVGDPSPQIDALWDHLEAASMVFLEGKEADQSREHTTFFNGYWLTGLDVFHQLHCLNQIRKAYYPEYYIPTDSRRTHKLHFEHCLDYVRQALMCNADITPVTHKFHETAGIFGPEFNALHTCRNFDVLLDWSLERNSAAADKKGSGSEVTKNRGRIVDKDHVAGGHHH